VTGWQAAFARLMNALDGVKEYDRCLELSGFEVVE
jgi:hypothetical protein